jgi:tetratricopeptide (TPR) repeat protein
MKHCEAERKSLPSPLWSGALLLTLGFSLATVLGIRREQSEHQKGESGSVLQVLMGDSRKLFANHFFSKADIYLHRGVYPSIFDQARREKALRLVAESSDSSAHDRGQHENCEHDDQGQDQDQDHDRDSESHRAGKHEADDAVTGLHGEPRDWIEAFGRNFYPTKHAHIEAAGEQKEILPWLRLAAELDPAQIETYTVGAYWLGQRMGKVTEAEQFLREGLRANPDSYEILFELGKLSEESRHDPARAKNLLEAALRRWQANEPGKPNKDTFGYMQIVGRLARLEETGGRLTGAVRYLEELREVSPNPDAVQKRIDELKVRLN